MNILLISPYFSPMVGGVETHLDDLCYFFNKQKHTVFVRTYEALGTKFRGLTNEKKGRIHIHRLWWSDFGLLFKLESYPILKFFYIFSGLFLDCLVFLVKKNKSIDVIQAHGFIAALMAVILGKMFSKRIIVNTHVGFKLKSGLTTKIIKWALLTCDKVLVLTNGIKDSLISLGIPKGKIDIYHYWVDKKRFNFQKGAKKKLGWEDKFVVLFVGRLIEVKGIRIIFDLAKSFKNITFAIAGSGPLGKEISWESKKHSNILFLGKIKNQNLPLYYSGADLLLIPSKIIEQEYEEGIPRVMIEALCCGLPVISTKAGGIPDVFSDKIGKLTDDDSKCIEKIIYKLYDNQSKIQSLHRNCRSYALKYFSIKNAWIIIKSLYV